MDAGARIRATLPAERDDDDMTESGPGSTGAAPSPLGAPAPGGRADFDLALGPLRLRVGGLPTSWDFVAQNYAPFCERVSAAAAPDLLIQCREEPARAVIPPPPPGGRTVIRVEVETDGRHRIYSHWQDGFVDVDRGVGELLLTDRRTDALRMSLENYLRVASQLLLLSRDCFLVHGAGVLDRDRCFLFFGPSGAGKTTVFNFSAPRPALSDDIVLVDLRGPRPQSWAAPFFGRFPLHERRRGTWPLAAALRLRQACEDRLEPLPAARAVATLSGSVPFVHELGVAHAGVTALAARLCEAVPVCDLHFTKSARFWDLLAQRFPG